MLSGGPGALQTSRPAAERRLIFVTSRLAYPTREFVSDGPFIFQVKFIEEANAPQAKIADRILDAVRKEAEAILARARVRKWLPPLHYILFTNAPLSVQLREQISSVLHEPTGGALVHCHGSSDVCDLLDNHPNLRRSFPQLLSLRDLDILLREATNAETLERSRAAIDSAREIVGVFVPTTAYSAAWHILRGHHFVVLEGPPEMGKTAIAWMISLAQVSEGWQAIACDRPEDFFSCYSRVDRQVFVADDAFGRTEYDPSRGNKWEQNLDRVIRTLDSNHWLLWTSRKHVLERALKEIDLQGAARHFPEPAAVLVDAGKLSTRERALILYRHGRSAGLEEAARNLVREHARSIVNNPSFTPERIRRFVHDRLPQLAAGAQTSIAAEIAEAIGNPTDRMRKAFRALTPTNKWLLISLLEIEARRPLEELRVAYERCCPIEVRLPFESVVDELSEAFVRSRNSNQGTIVDWVHPSCRDLVIDELRADPPLLAAFLNRTSLDGINLAISHSGGLFGEERRQPLVTTAQGWQCLRRRCLALASEGDATSASHLLLTLTSALGEESDSSARGELTSILGDACRLLVDRWNSTRAVLSGFELQVYIKASELLIPLPPMPSLDASWQAVNLRFMVGLERCEPDGPLQGENWLKPWVNFLEAVSRSEPRLLKQVRSVAARDHQVERLLHVLELELKWDRSLDFCEEYESEAERFDGLASLVESIRSIFPIHESGCDATSNRLSKRAAELREQAEDVPSKEPPDMDDDERRPLIRDEWVDLATLFSDL